MKTLKKLALSAIAFVMLAGGKPVLAQEQDTSVNLPSETLSTEAVMTSSSDMDAVDLGETTSLSTSQTSVDSMSIATESPTENSLTEVISSADVAETDTDVDSSTDTTITTDNDSGDNDATDLAATDGENTEVSVAEKVQHLTVLNGVDYSLVYDYEYYSANEDVKAAFGDDEEKTLYNFVRWGMRSQRQGIATFDEVSYRYAYQDLRLAYGTDYKSYYLHYIKYGYSEGRSKTTGITAILNPVTVEGGRDYAAVYDYYYYSANEDVAEACGDDDVATLHNFVQFGIQQRRQGNEDFNVCYYKNNYASLRKTYGSNMAGYYLHYIRWGKAAGLVADQSLPHDPITVLNGVDYSLVYSYEYFHANKDVAAAFSEDEEATLQNFVRWGMQSGRQGIATFDVYSYKNAYQDLRAAYLSDLTKYYLHYIKYGYAEGRSLTTGVTERLNCITVQDGVDYSAVYNFTYFQKKYPDVKAAFGEDEVATLANFVRWGMEGGRQGSAEFNVYSYMSNYPELENTYGSNLRGYYLHYIRWGKAASLVADVTIIEVTSCIINADDNVEVTATVNGFDTEQTFGLFVLVTGQKSISGLTPLTTATGIHSIVLITPLNLNTSSSLLTEKMVIALKNIGSFTQISSAYYITNPEAVAENTRSFPVAASKKGLQVNMNMISDAADLGVNHAVVNITIANFVASSGGIPYVYNGKTYYMDGVYVAELDRNTEALAAQGIIVTGVVLMSWDTDALDLILPGARTAGYPYYGFNIVDKDARDHIAAIFSFLAERYTDANHNVVNWSMGNEVNAFRSWHWCGNLDIDTFTEYYTDTYRLLYNCVKSKYSNARCYISLDQWFNGCSSSGAFAGKDVLTRFAERLKKEGDINWCISTHPYSTPLTDPRFWVTKSNVTYSEDSVIFTMLNINYLTGYIRKTYGAQHRFILSEVGYSSYYNGVTDENVQAAALAYAYYLAEFEDIYDMIDSFIVHRHVDNQTEMGSGLYLGLWKNNSGGQEYASRKKVAWTIFKYMDTAQSKEYTNYLVYVFGATCWEEIVPRYNPAKFA